MHANPSAPRRANVAGTRGVFDPDAPPRPRRSLRAPAPEVRMVTASDGVPLRLTRYEGGARGPVLLAHGLGVSSRIFSTDTIDTNLVEFLCARGFDVWLLDGRTSIDLATAGDPADGDEVATRDYPAAVDAIRAATGARDLQVVAHCFGGTTFTMALLAGLQGVRSAVISQVSTHVDTGAFTRLKTGTRLPSVLSALGVRSLSAHVDTRTPWHEQLIDRALRLLPLPGESCASTTCRRVTFMYSPLYEHGQLNALTHEHLHELFGTANTRAFVHLALIVRKGHVVDADGRDAYLPHLDRMAIPITFIHGAKNACYLPASTERTVAALAARNGEGLYRRHVIPDYGHIDCIFGESAARDVYPLILEQLEDTAD